MHACAAILREDADLINGRLPSPRIHPAVRQACSARHMHVMQSPLNSQPCLVGVNDC